MTDPRYDPETVSRAAAVAAAMPSAECPAAGDDSLTADEMASVAAEAGIDPGAMRQALGHVLADDAARKRETVLRRRLLIAGIVAAALAIPVLAGWVPIGVQKRSWQFSAAGEAVGPQGTYYRYTHSETHTETRSGSFRGAPVSRGPFVPPMPPPGPVRTVVAPIPPAGPPAAGPMPVNRLAMSPRLRSSRPEEPPEQQVRRRIEEENRAWIDRDHNRLARLHNPVYRLHRKDGRVFNYTQVLQDLADLPRYPRDWQRTSFLQELQATETTATAVLLVTVHSSDSSGRPQDLRFRVRQAWTLFGKDWLKTEDREL